MKKLIVPCILGLTLGLGGAMGIVISREKEARAAALALAGDSTKVVADSAAAPPADSAVAHEAPQLPDSVTMDTAAVLLDSASAHPDTAAAALDVPTAVAGPDEQRLSRIFAAMKPNEAARVLERMSDPEIHRLLSHLKDRQAAAILSSLSPERAAAISRAVIHGGKRTR